jgi:hypothetical protein
MALIPPDAGVRMRMQTESSILQPLAPVKAISPDLPDLQPGQAFTARILEALPENTYKALVAGKQLTLQLPEGAAAGDTLELVLIDRTPKTLIAQRAETPAPPSSGNQPYPYARISNAGHMIGQLLLPEGEAPQPAPLNRGQPLLSQPPVGAAELAPTLAKAVSQSGLFYEAHQAQWLAGQRPLESLRAEPQGQLPPATRQVGQDQKTTLPLAVGADIQTRQAATGKTEAGHPQVTAASLTPTGATPTTDRTASSVATQTVPTPQTIPDEVRPIVQQQLDAVASQRLSWHGEVWPGQVVDWQIERDRAEQRDTAPGTAEGATRWSTTLRLTMPRLGTVDATLQLAGNTLRLNMASSSGNAADSLRQRAPTLAQALADAGVVLQSLDIRHEA